MLIPMMPYERLTAWRVSHQLVLGIYKLTSSFPSRELFGLTSQTRRAAFSIAANIAEGAAKRSKRDFARFLDISLGSLSETAYALTLARDLGYLTQADWEGIDQVRNRTGQLVWRLYRACQERSQTPTPRVT